MPQTLQLFANILRKVSIAHNRGKYFEQIGIEDIIIASSKDIRIKKQSIKGDALQIKENIRDLGIIFI